MRDEELARLDAVATAAAIASGEVSAEEVIEATLERIEAIDPTLNAVIHRDDESARQQVQHLRPDAPFAGVPMLVKDLFSSSAGDPMHLGITALRDAGYRHPTDSNIVTRYREAGFVLCGRTNTPELGLVATTEPTAHGPTRNPWDPSRGAGGSSGGAAAAVASGMVPAANASDGGGSIRIPAAACGLVGLKPSRGRVSMGPLADEAGLSTQHVVSRSVRETAAILDVTAIGFPGDALWAPAPSRPWADEVGAPTTTLRVGLMATSTRTETDAPCEAAARAAAALLEDMGHDVSEAHPAALDDPEALGEAFMAVWFANCRNNLTWVEGVLGRPLTADDVEPGTWFIAAAADQMTAPALAAAQSTMASYRRLLAGWWADDGFDLLLTPTMAAVTPELGHLASTPDDPTLAMRRSAPYATFTSPFNVSGQPAISLPTATDPDGLPVGIQLVAAYGREDLLLRVASAIEEAVGWDERIPPVHATRR